MVVGNPTENPMRKLAAITIPSAKLWIPSPRLKIGKTFSNSAISNINRYIRFIPMPMIPVNEPFEKKERNETHY